MKNIIVIAATVASLLLVSPTFAQQPIVTDNYVLSILEFTGQTSEGSVQFELKTQDNTFISIEDCIADSTAFNTEAFASNAPYFAVCHQKISSGTGV